MVVGSIVKIGKVGRTYGLGLEASDEESSYGVIVEIIDMQKFFNLPRSSAGAKVYTSGKVEVFFNIDLEEIK